MKITKGVRWTVNKAAPEFGIHRETLSKRIKNAGIVAGQDGCFSTLDICKAVNGDLESERIRETKESADRLALGNQKTRSEIVNSVAVGPVFESVFVPIRQIIKQSSMSAVEKHDCLAQLREISIDDVLEAASRELAEDTADGT